ncbi:hypothetical protein [uncultured Helicobacter sp.]|nr:hypothetical protein [uncultured Helicobacter sp.]
MERLDCELKLRVGWNVGLLGYYEVLRLLAMIENKILARINESYC